MADDETFQSADTPDAETPSIDPGGYDSGNTDSTANFMVDDDPAGRDDAIADTGYSYDINEHGIYVQTRPDGSQWTIGFAPGHGTDEDGNQIIVPAYTPYSEPATLDASTNGTPGPETLPEPELEDFTPLSLDISQSYKDRCQARMDLFIEDQMRKASFDIGPAPAAGAEAATGAAGSDSTAQSAGSAHQPATPDIPLEKAVSPADGSPSNEQQPQASATKEKEANQPPNPEKTQEPAQKPDPKDTSPSIDDRLRAQGIDPDAIRYDSKGNPWTAREIDASLIAQGVDPDSVRYTDDQGKAWTERELANLSLNSGFMDTMRRGLDLFKIETGIEKFTLIKDIPHNAIVNYTNPGPEGKEFNAPPDADFNAIFESGKANGKDEIAKLKAIFHCGTYDFQRDCTDGKRLFYPHYTDASNYAVGVYMSGAGYSLDETIQEARKVANRVSSNAKSGTQEAWWIMGWHAGNTGKFSAPAR